MHTLYTVYSFGIAFTDRKYAILLRIRSHLKLKKNKHTVMNQTNVFVLKCSQRAFLNLKYAEKGLINNYFFQCTILKKAVARYFNPDLFL